MGRRPRLIMNLSELFVVMTIWDTFIDPFVYLAENLIGHPILIGVIIFLFITMFGLLMFIPFEAMTVIWIPMCLVVAIYIPPLQIVVAIMVGIIIGIGLLKWIRR
jgi:hypothetical protein